MEITTERKTYIFVTENTVLYPADDLFPDDELFPNTGRHQISNIVDGTLLLEEKIIEDLPVFGKIFSTRFEVQVYDESDLSGLYIHVYQLDDGVYHSIFTGIVDSCKLDKVGRDRKIVAYDMAYSLGNVNVANWWEQFWNGRESATLKEVRNSLMQSLSGISYEDVNLPNDSLVVQKNVEFTSLPFFTILSMICELSACFPHIDRDGVMRFICFNALEQPESLINEYEWNSSNFEEYETEKITGVQFYDSDGELKYTVGTAKNVISITNNVFLYTLDFDGLQSIGESIMNVIANYCFKPADVHMIIGNFNLKLGQLVSTENGSFYILQQIFSGPQFIEQEIKAPGQQYLNQGTQPVDLKSKITNQKIARVSQTIDEFKIEYQDFAEQTSSSLKLNSEAIETEVTRAQTREEQINNRVSTVNENLSSRITQTAEAIQMEVTRAQIAESTIDGRLSTVSSTLSSRITQTANSIETAVSAERTRAEQVEGSLNMDVENLDGRISTVNETLSSRITQTANSIETAVSTERTRAQQEEENLSSRITQTSNSIQSEVTRAQGAESTLSSRITQTAEGISSKVEKGTVSSEISQESDKVTIKSNRLIVQADNFTLNDDGTITCTNAVINGILRTTGKYEQDSIMIGRDTIGFHAKNGTASLINPAFDFEGYINCSNSGEMQIMCNDGLFVDLGIEDSEGGDAMLVWSNDIPPITDTIVLQGVGSTNYRISIHSGIITEVERI